MVENCVHAQEFLTQWKIKKEEMLPKNEEMITKEILKKKEENWPRK